MRRFARLLLAAYPRAFRRRFGDAFIADVSALAVERGPEGRWAHLRLGAWLVVDVVRSAPGEWWDLLSTTRPRHSPSLPTPGTRMQLVRDFQVALRALRRTPALVLVVALSLGLGIGANALVFSVLDGIILRPFEYPHPDRLVAIGGAYPSMGSGRRYIETHSPPEMLDVRSGVSALERTAAFDLGNRALSGGDVPERVFTAFVWGDLLATLGVQPALGRAMRDEETAGENRVALISHRIWQSRFGGDTAVVGSTVRVNGDPHQIIGVMPPQVLLMGTDLWVPMGVPMTAIPRQARQFAMLGRIREGRTLDDVNAELARVAATTATAWTAEHPVYRGWSLAAAPWHVALTSEDNVRQTGFVLQAAVFLVLLIAWVNVAGLLMARGAAREGEFATRRALGAATHRLVSQLMAEGIVLALVGAALGLLLCAIAAPRLTEALPDQLRGMGFGIRVNARVVWVTLLGAVGAGAAFALLPAGALRSGPLGAVLGQWGRTSAGRVGARSRALCLGGQVALSVMLLSAAGLLVQSMRQLARVELGVNPASVLTMRVSVAREQYADSAIIPFIERLSARVAAVPGVRAVGAATQFGVPNFTTAPVTLAGEAPSGVERRADITSITPEFFTTLGHRLQGGRLFDARDGAAAPRVAVINESAVRRYFAGRPAIGELLVLGDSLRSATVEVVGVVADTRNRGLDAPVEPEVFVPARQQHVGWNNQFFLLARTAQEPMSLVGAIRAAIREIDPEQPVYAIATFESRLGAAMVQRSAAMMFLVVFAVIALTLAAAGVYGMVSYAVAQRTREIGIRMALGADGGRVRQLVLGQAIRVIGIGAALGVVAAVALSGAMRGLVYGVSATDPTMYLGAVALLGVASVCAVLPPLRRATRVAPAVVMRD